MKLKPLLIPLGLCVLSLSGSSQEPRISPAVPAADDAAEVLQVILDNAGDEQKAHVEAFMAGHEAGMGLKGSRLTEHHVKMFKMIRDFEASVDAHAVQVLILVKGHPDTETSRNGLEWLLSKSGSRSRAPLTIDLLAQEYIGDERLGDVCLKLSETPARDTLVSTLKRIVENSPHHQVRGKASWALALQYKRFAESTTKVPTAGLEARAEADAGSWDGKFRVQLQVVLDQYADLLDGRKTLASMAEALLIEYELARTGTLAPEIEGEDLDGVPFKLSDYRGKVVVLDFWGHW